MYNPLSKKAQSALEYMMTYGWAILIIVIVAVILYSMGIFNPSSSVTATSSGFSPFTPSSAICTAGPGGYTEISFVVGGLPNGASSVTIDKLYLTSPSGFSSSSSKQSTYISPTTVTPGQTFNVVIAGENCSSSGISFSSAASLQYSYSTPAGNVNANATGTIAGKSSTTEPTTFSAYGLPVGASWTVEYAGLNVSKSTNNNISFGSISNVPFKVFPVVFNGVTYYPVYASGPSSPFGYNLDEDFISNDSHFYIGEQGGENMTIFYPYNQSTGANITLGNSGHSAIILTPSGNDVYAVAEGSNTTYEVSVSTNKIVGSIHSKYPISLAITPNGKYLYIGCQNNNNISVVSTSTNTIIKNISINAPASSFAATGIAVNPNGKYVYVSIISSNVTSVISTKTNTVIKNISIDSPDGIAVSPNGEYVYVSDEGASKISVIQTSTNSIITNISVPYSPSPRGLALTSNGKYLYVTSGNLVNNMSVINTETNSVIATINIPVTKQLSFSPNGKYLYVTTPYAYPYQLEEIYVSNNTYKNLTTVNFNYNICSINIGPLGNSGEC